jgi:transposase
MKKTIVKGHTVVVFADETDLQYGETQGYVWALAGKRVWIPMGNYRQSQTYYGALELLTRRFHLRAYSSANGENTVRFLGELLSQFPLASKLIVIWDGARFHTSQLVSAFLAQLNTGLPPCQWRIECILLAPNAPEQNPVEDCWLKAKNFVRQHGRVHTCFKQVCECFEQAFRVLSFNFNKLNWYF